MNTFLFSICILFFIFVFCVYLIITKNYYEKFTLELKNNINFIVYPNIDKSIINKFMKLCRNKFKTCNKIKINYDLDLKMKIKKNTKYIILYDSNSKIVKNNKNYYKKFNKKYLINNNKYFFKLDTNNFINNYKSESKKLLKFVDVNLNINNLNLLSLL